MRWKPALWADDSQDYENSAGNPLYKKADLVWKRPTVWSKNDKFPKFDDSEAFLYALIRNDGRFKDKDRIEYIGLTSSPKRRFGNHPTARQIVSQQGKIQFSYAPIQVQGRERVKRLKSALEDIEHLLIWSVSDYLWNKQKVGRLPGMGANAGEAWHIVNSGYRFSGRMPREILYPSILMVPGKDRFSKKMI